jgi:outer membrane autotransporter protein
VSIVNAGGEGGETTGNGILIIDAETNDTGSGAFVLADAVTVSGAYQYTYTLNYDPADFAWYLQSTREEFAGTAEYPALVAGALLAWQVDLPQLHDRLHDLRWGVYEKAEEIEPAAWTGSPPGLRPWLHVTSGSQEVDTDTSFDQQTLKLEGGADAVMDAANGGHYLLGAFAGTGRYEQNFDASSSKAEADVALGGVYAGYRAGAFYGNAIIKYEHQWIDYRGAATGDEAAPFEAGVAGVSLESGYRFAFDQAYVQPRARLSYAHAWLSSFDDSSGETVDLRNAESLLGELGARLGMSLPRAWGVAHVHLDAGLRHEFLGNTRAEVSDLVYTRELPGTVGVVAAGAAMTFLEDKLSLLLDAGYARGEEAEEVTAAAGLRVMY